jgi:hypothetical protein
LKGQASAVIAGQPPVNNLFGYSAGEGINKMRPKDEAFHRARGSPNPLTRDKYNLFSVGKGTFLTTLPRTLKRGTILKKQIF